MAELPDGELACAVLPGGDRLTLLKRGDLFEIRFNLLELMSSRIAASERALARLACERLSGAASDILVGGLGMGFTLRSVLDRVGPRARVTVAELLPEVVEWNNGALAGLAGRPLEDPRVEIRTGDVADVLRSNPGRFDAVLMDVDNGPEAILFPSNRSLYSSAGLELVLSALKPAGIFALWAADRSPDFERLVEAAGHPVERVEVSVEDGASGTEHSIYLVERPLIG